MLGGLLVLLFFSKHQFLDSLNFELCFQCVCCFIVLWSSLFPSFYCLWAVFVVFPPVLVGIGSGCSLERFLFWIGLYCCKLPSQDCLWCDPSVMGRCKFIFICFHELFWFPPWYHAWPIHCLIACCLICMSLSGFEFSPWRWFLHSGPCGQRKCVLWFQFSWICGGVFCQLSRGLSLKMFHVHLKKNTLFCFFGIKCSVYIK